MALKKKRLKAKKCNKRGNKIFEKRRHLKEWGERRGLNPRPPESQSGALPTELRSPQNIQQMVREERLELSHLTAPEPKSGVSTNSTTPAWQLSASLNLSLLF